MVYNFRDNFGYNLEYHFGDDIWNNCRDNFWENVGNNFGINLIWCTILETILGRILGTILRKFIHLFFLIFSGIRTECPSGTKCVAEFFCNENAIMVAYRVNLTPAQKKQRGSLTVSFSSIDINELRRVSHYFPILTHTSHIRLNKTFSWVNQFLLLSFLRSSVKKN